MFLSPDLNSYFHFLIQMRQAEQSEQPEGKWGERKTASGPQGILIRALIVMVRAQRQNKHKWREGKMVADGAGLTLRPESDWAMVSGLLRRARHVRDWRDDYGGWERSIRRKLGTRSWCVCCEGACEVSDGGQLLSESQLLFSFWNNTSKQKSTAKKTNGKVKGNGSDMHKKRKPKPEWWFLLV